MAIDITAVGATGVHSLAKVTVNTDDNYIYYKNTVTDKIPTAFTVGKTFIYTSGAGSLLGLTDGDLLYVTTETPKKLKFSYSSGGASVDITGSTPGGINFNTPILYSGKLNIDASTPTNQAVKYFTNGAPLTGLTSGSTYFLKNVDISAFSGSQALYSFTGHTFTTCGVTGRVGPTRSQMAAAYSSITWDDSYLAQGRFQGYQDWTVPVSGEYQFTVSGASGYDTTGAGGIGRGARVRGSISLTKGEVITIAVGQVGEKARNTSIFGGGGGASFVVRKEGNEALFVAGGGSGEGNTVAGRDGVLTKLGGPSSTNASAGTTEGNGGLASNGRSGAGGGFTTRGGNATQGSNTLAYGGGSFADGLTMTTIATRNGGYGGFGGGGMGDADSAGQSGGGGGYSGGAGSRNTNSNTSGGGGGSFITPTAIGIATSNGTYNTTSTFNGTAIVNLAAYNTGEGSVAVSLVRSFTTGNSVHPTAADAEAGLNAIAIESGGTSYHSLVPITIDAASNEIHSPAPHTLSNGEAVTFTFTGTTPADVLNSTIYYVEKISNFTYKLSTTPLPTFSTVDLSIPAGKDVGTNSLLSRVVVNTITNTLTIPNHGFLVDQPLQYDTGGGVAISPLQDLTTYYVAEVVSSSQIKLKTSLDSPNAIDFLSAGTGTGHSFIFLTVNLLEDTLYVPNHGLVSGQAIKYSNGAGTSIGGLIHNSNYYVLKVDASLIKLSPNSNLSSPVNLSTVGAGTHSLIVTSLDLTDNAITVPGHGFLAGELVEYDAKGNTPVGGLTTATPYYVIFINGDKIRLATTPENANENISIDLTSTGVGTHALRSLSKTPDGIYTIKTVPSAKTFTAEAKGNVPVLTKTFNPRASLDLNLNAFKLESHGLLTGTKVTYLQGDSATDIAGLVNNTDYYTLTINKDYIRLSSTAENASAGITLDVTDYGTGVAHQFITAQINGYITGGGNVSVGSGSVLVNGSGTSFSKILKVGDNFRLFPNNTTTTITFAATDINTTNNRITKAHTFATGDTVVFDNGGGASPAPLVDEYYYFVRSISSTEITLHSSADDATNDLNAIDFSTQGTGSAFKLTKTVPVGPIIRRITAIGSDTQITVDRPYSNAYTNVAYTYPTFVYVRPEGYSLHRPFDGGVEMSVGAGTSLGQIVRQTRKYFRYQSGKGIQTSAGINFKPSIDLESMFRYSPTTIEAKTRRPHGLKSGLYIVVSQAETAASTPENMIASEIYNGTFQVTVVDLTTFRLASNAEVPEGLDARAYGFPQFFVREWSGGAIRSGMFDFQNGMFYEFDGQKMYAVRRSSTQQIAGTVAVLQGSELVFGTGTQFTAQLEAGDYIVMRGQTYRIADIESDTRLTVRPEYKGSSGVQKEFDPGNGTTGVVRIATDIFQLIGHGFAAGIPVVYNSIDGEPIGGLINGRTYYVDLIDNNSFRLKASPDGEVIVNLSTVGTTSVHALTPAKSGIIVTKTVDTRIPQEDWSIDPCDGTGVTGYKLDVSKIQMVYIDYSWYGAGKIRFGFKTTNGQVEYIHEFVHNNQLFESYFRSGNMPARYEVVTYDNPTYIPSLFHWGTSVIMDGRFDDDRAYLFTASSQSLTVPGTTAKSFSSGAINLNTEAINISSHGFKTGDLVQFQGVATDGLPGLNTQNPAIDIVTGGNQQTNLTNVSRYEVATIDANNIELFPVGPVGISVSTSAQAAAVVTLVTATNHGMVTGQFAKISGLTRVPNGTYAVTVTNATTFTYTVTTTATTTAAADTAGLVLQSITFNNRGNTQYTYFLYPNGSLNNTSGPNYQPLISIRLSPSVSSGLTGKLGDRDIINRMQLRLREVGISSTQLLDVKLLLNARLNNLNFQAVDAPSLVQIVEHTSADTVSGGTQVYNFRAAGGNAGSELSTTVDVAELFELSNSILGGDSTFPDGPDILTIAVARLTGSDTVSGAKLSWTEAQA